MSLTSIYNYIQPSYLVPIEFTIIILILWNQLLLIRFSILFSPFFSISIIEIRHGIVKCNKRDFQLQKIILYYEAQQHQIKQSREQSVVCCLSVAAFMWESFDIYEHSDIQWRNHLHFGISVSNVLVLELSSIPISKKELIRTFSLKMRLCHSLAWLLMFF